MKLWIDIDTFQMGGIQNLTLFYRFTETMYLTLQAAVSHICDSRKGRKPEIHIL
jgi:hypothetical protein